jgi:hypothetical protein
MASSSPSSLRGYCFESELPALLSLNVEIVDRVCSAYIKMKKEFTLEEARRLWHEAEFNKDQDWFRPPGTPYNWAWSRYEDTKPVPFFYLGIDTRHQVRLANYLGLDDLSPNVIKMATKVVAFVQEISRGNIELYRDEAHPDNMSLWNDLSPDKKEIILRAAQK